MVHLKRKLMFFRKKNHGFRWIKLLYPVVARLLLGMASDVQLFTTLLLILIFDRKFQMNVKLGLRMAAPFQVSIICVKLCWI